VQQLLAIPYPPRAPDLYGYNGRLWGNGRPLDIRGINWWGTEGVWRLPFGLLERPIDEYLDFMVHHQFNAWRLMFSWDSWVADEPVPPAHFSASRNPSLLGKSYRQMLLHLVRAASHRGILVLLACHRIRIAYNTDVNGVHAEWPGDWDGLWYDSAYSEERVETLWGEVAQLFCAQWNVMGVDLMNEPYTAHWGDGSRFDWQRGATRMGNAALSGCPRWLIVVQGTSNPGMFGENLVGVQANNAFDAFDTLRGDSPNDAVATVAPHASGMVALTNRSKLVYSAHSYGPSLFLRSGGEPPEFHSRDFPHGNMPDHWEWLFGHVTATGAPILMGEIGGDATCCDGQDYEWHTTMLSYLERKHIGLFYFCLNANSDDTNGSQYRMLI